MKKYQYWYREVLFRFLRNAPKVFQKTAVKYLVGRNRSLLENLKTPAQIILYVTNRCNARCQHCFYWQEVASGIKKELTLDQIIKIARTLKNPLNTLSITGGEPFLRDDLPLIVKAFSEINRTNKINIVTNGYFTSKILKQVEQMVKYPLDLNVQVSLDGRKKVHDQIRRIPIFESAVETLKQLSLLSQKNKNLQVTIQATITRYNLEEIEELTNFVESRLSGVHLGFQFVRSPALDVYGIDRDFLSNLDPKEEKPLLTINQMKKALKLIEKTADFKNSLLDSYVKVMNRHIIRLKEDEKPFVKCLAGRYDAVIWPDGQVSMCEFTKPFASLSEYDFDYYRLWVSDKANQARGKIKECFCAHTCNLMNAMQFDQKALLEVLND